MWRDAFIYMSYHSLPLMPRQFPPLFPSSLSRQPAWLLRAPRFTHFRVNESLRARVSLTRGKEQAATREPQKKKRKRYHLR